MKGKRYTTEDKIRILRDADQSKNILEVCRGTTFPSVSFHRWKRRFGQMELSEPRRLKELERENGELMKRLAEALLKNRVLEAAAQKNGRPGASKASRPRWSNVGRAPWRMSCRFLLLARATFFYRGYPVDPRQQRLANRLRVLSEASPRYG